MKFDEAEATGLFKPVADHLAIAEAGKEIARFKSNEDFAAFVIAAVRLAEWADRLTAAVDDLYIKNLHEFRRLPRLHGCAHRGDADGEGDQMIARRISSSLIVRAKLRRATCRV